MTHEFDGNKYEKASTHQREWGSKLIGELDLKGHERILDLGCGDGTLTAQLAELAPRGDVVGIDASQGMIEAALPKERSNLRFRRLDINDLDDVEAFDLVFSNAALHWVKDHRRLLRNVHRALRAGGRMRLNFAGKGNCSNLFAVVQEAMAQPEFRAFFAEFEWPWYMPSVEEYSALMAASGMDDGQVWGENADRHFPDAEAMIKWLDQPSLVPFLAHVPAADKSAFRGCVIQGMREETQESDGRCFETFRRINASAHK